MKLKSIWLAAGIAILTGTNLTTWAQGPVTQTTFPSTPGGAIPLQLVWTNGLFYGSTGNGGSQGDGSIFTYNTNSQSLATIFSFTNASGFGSEPNPVLVTSTAIYGTTELDGANGEGMIYTMNTDGTGFTPLYNFLNYPAPGGYTPLSGLVLSGTTLYGTASSGGTNSGGTLFEINTTIGSSSYQPIHWFTNNPDGLAPQGQLVLAGNVLYGTTAYGGTNGAGTIYAIHTDGSGYAVLYDFSNTPDGAYPSAGLTLEGAFLYGATSGGGINQSGAVFEINTNGSGYSVLHSFGPRTESSDNADGETPKFPMTAGSGGLYGTTITGGLNGGGTLFFISTNGTGFAVLANFTNGAASGWDPESGVVRVGNNLWGTTSQGNGTTVFGTLYSLTLPAIIMEPQSLTVSNNNPASFTITPADDLPITYKWYFNTNTLLTGQTTNVLTLASAGPGNAGTYTVSLSDSFGTVTSSPAVLTVIAPPVITTQPQNASVLVSNSASFTSVASGAAPLAYQWYFNTNTLLSGQTSSVLDIPSALTNQAGYYTVIVTNLYGSATSTPALLTVNVGIKPVITESPQNYTVTNGLVATFTNTASGTAPLFYEWFFNTSTLVSSGVNDTVLTVSPATTNQAGSYTAVVTNAFGSATSAPALLTVIVPPSKPVFTQQPQSYAVTNGYNASFTNIVTGTMPVYYQWYFNTNTAIAGGTNAILTVTSVTTNQAGYYSVVVSNIAGSVTSSSAQLTVISTKPIIITQPSPLTVTNDAPFSFTVVAAGLPPLKYQWYTNVVFPSSLQTGKTNSVYTNSATSTKFQAYYIVVITNSLGKLTSSPALLTILTKPVMTLQPQSVVVNNGDPATFTAAAEGPGPLDYQWYFRTNTSVAGATGTTLTFTNAITNLAGYYDVRVTNSFGAVTSSFALLTISNVPNLLSFDFANGSPSFAFAAIPKGTNRLWATTNLAVAGDWQVIATNVMATNGLWFYTDTNAAATNRVRFYRFSGQ